MIRAIGWHPRIPGALVVGSSNGSLRKLRFDTSTPPCQVTSAFVFSLMSVDLYGQDARCLDVVHKLEGYIHALTFNQRGDQLAVAYGDMCVVALMDQDGDNFGKSMLNGTYLVFILLPQEPN